MIYMQAGISNEGKAARRMSFPQVIGMGTEMEMATLSLSLLIHAREVRTISGTIIRLIVSLSKGINYGTSGVLLLACCSWDLVDWPIKYALSSG